MAFTGSRECLASRYCLSTPVTLPWFSSSVRLSFMNIRKSNYKHF